MAEEVTQETVKQVEETVEETVEDTTEDVVEEPATDPAPEPEKAEEPQDEKPEPSPAELKLARIEALDSAGLPIKLAGWIQASEKDAVLAEAQELIAAVGTVKRAPSNRPIAPRGTAQPAVEVEETDPRKLAALVPRY